MSTTDPAQTMTTEPAPPAVDVAPESEATQTTETTPAPVIAPDPAASPEPVVQPAAPPAETPPAADTPQTAPQARTAPTSAPADPEPPYLRWRVTDAADSAGATLQQTTSFTVQGPRVAESAADAEESVQWAASLTATVEDNTGQEGYAGLDLDPRIGYFTVKQLIDDTNPASTHDVTASEGYRVRPAAAPAGFAVGDAAEWTGFDSTIAAVTDEQMQRVVLSAPVTDPQARGDVSAMADEDGGGIVLFSVGPDGGEPPYIYWKAVNRDTGDPVQGASFSFAYRNGGSGAGGWTQSTVTDCVAATAAGCSSSFDRDPDPGEFLLTHRAASQTTGNRLVDGNNYRLRQNGAPSGYTWTVSGNNDKTIGTTNGNDGIWNEANGDLTHNFGTFELTPPLSTKEIVVRKRVFANPTEMNGSVGTNIGSDYSNTAGTVFRLYPNVNNAPDLAHPTSFFCQITTGGECKITVTGVNSGGENYNKRFWVVEDTSAPNTYANPELYVGSYNGPTQLRRLVGLTQQLTASTTQMYMPMTNSGVAGGTVITNNELPGTDANVTRAGSFGAMANSYWNPAIDPKCDVVPLRIALVLDQSASIQEDQWDTFRDALVGGSDSVLALLKGAGAYVSILGFGSDVSGSNGWHYGSTGPALLPSDYASLIPNNRPGGSGNATNWDAALSEIQRVNGTHDYDMVLFVTDGAPNYTNTGSNSTDVSLRSLEAPIYAANAIKAAGTRMVAVGVGNGGSGSQVAANLRAVSGVTATSDYIQGDWVRLKTILTNIVKAATCTVPIEVSKTEVSADGAVNEYAAGWTFDVENMGDKGTLTGPDREETGAGESGMMGWNLKFSKPSGESTDLKFSEAAQSGWTLSSVDCTVAGQDVETTIAEDGSVTLEGITTTSEKVVCVFTNREQTAGVSVDKVWKVQDQTGEVLNTYTIPGTGSAVPPAWLVASPTIGGQTDPQWGGTYNLTSSTVAIGESASLGQAAPPGCVLGTQRVTAVNGTATGSATTYDVSDGKTYTHTLTASPNPNTVTITNTVTCTTSLTLLKEVDKSTVPTSTMQPSDWKLTAAAGAAKPLDGVLGSGSVSTSNTAAVIAGSAYTLSEASVNGQLAYVQLGIQKCKSVTGFGATASCAEWENGYIDADQVSVELGQQGIYRFVNQPIPPIAVPLTGGMSSDFFTFGGLGVAALAAVLALAYWRRSQRRAEVA